METLNKINSDLKQDPIWLAKEEVMISVLGVSSEFLADKENNRETLSKLISEKKEELIVALSNLAIIGSETKVFEGKLTLEEANNLKQSIMEDLAFLSFYDYQDVSGEEIK